MNNDSLRTNNLLLFIVCLMSSFILIGCANNVVPKGKIKIPNQPNNIPNNIVVWADDGSEVAIVKLKSEEKQGSSLEGATDKHYQHQIIVQNLEGSRQHIVTGWRDYKNGQIFYMKQAGYFVVESLLENGKRHFDKIAANGNEILIIETPDDTRQPCQEKKSTNPNKLAQIRHSVIPSPDGQQLAHIYSPECGKVTVEFLHANNLNIFDAQTINIDKPMQATWHPDGYVILATNNNDKAWKVTVLTPPQPITPPHCLSPVTTSSEVSLEGKMVYFEGEKLITKNVDRQKTFGCQ